MSSSAQTSVILAADIVGYSRMMNEDHDCALERLRSARDNVIEPGITSNRGFIVKRLGDGWLAAFENASDACASAIKIQEQMASYGAVRLRIGIHAGVASFVDDDVFGTAVNIASRMEALAKPGGIAVSDAVFAEFPKEMQVSFENAGPRVLKNIADPIKVWAFGGIPPESATSAPVSVQLGDFTSRSEGDELALDLPDAIATVLDKYRWLDVLKFADDKRKPKYFLSGSIRRSGDRMRVAVALSTREHGRRLWREQYDRIVSDEFELLDELGANVALRVSAEIDAFEKSLAGMRPPEQLNSAELSVRANDLMSLGDLNAFAEADAMLTRAVALEPRNASAHVQKSFVGYRKAMSGAWPFAATLQTSLNPAMQAARLDPKISSAPAMLACIHGMLGKTEAALDAAMQTERLNPNAWGAPHARSIAYTFATPSWAARHDPECTLLIKAAERTLEMAKASKFRSGHLLFLGIGQLLRDASAELQPAISTLERSAGAPGAIWWPYLFLALAELRRGNQQLAGDHIAAARNLFSALSLSLVAEIFERSRIWPVWRKEMDRLSDFGLPT